tara:strand:- start:1378 stop:2337 length:960 start_codon:yes stop_codon:yes gene_type:complete
MSDNQDSIDNELKINIPKRAKFIAISWLFICGIIFSSWLNFSPDNTVHSLSLGDVGAFLSGIFSILALYGFIEAYLIQSKELRLQRFELKESIKAQQGSEKALKEQSEALKSQLKINEEQFNLYLLEAKAKIPVFNLSEIYDFRANYLDKETNNLNEIDLLKNPLSSVIFSKHRYTLKEIFFSIKMINRGGGKLIHIKKLTEIDSSYYYHNNNFRILDNLKNEIYDNYLVDFYFKIELMDLDVFQNHQTLKNFVISFIEGIKFESTFRSREKSYKQKYQTCRTNAFDQFLQHKNASVCQFEQIEMQKLLKFGYDIEIFE